MEKSNLKLWTGYVSPYSMKALPGKDMLPIFIVRNISGSSLIGCYQGTSIHFRNLAPSVDLFRSWKTGELDWPGYSRGYLMEMSHLDLGEVIRKLELLTKVSGATGGAVLLGFGADRTHCHRSVLSDVLNQSGLLSNPVEEITL